MLLRLRSRTDPKQQIHRCGNAARMNGDVQITLQYTVIESSILPLRSYGNDAHHLLSPGNIQRKYCTCWSGLRKAKIFCIMMQRWSSCSEPRKIVNRFEILKKLDIGRCYGGISESSENIKEEICMHPSQNLKLFCGVELWTTPNFGLYDTKMNESLPNILKENKIATSKHVKVLAIPYGEA